MAGDGTLAAGSVTVSGPFFDQAERTRLARQWEHEAATQLAEKGSALIKDTLNASIRHPTMPDYGGRRVRTSVASGTAEIYDSNVIYGPWLEGQGTRNSPVTRFPGYWSFRRSFQQINANAEAWSYQAIEHYLNELNGGIG